MHVDAIGHLGERENGLIHHVGQIRRDDDTPLVLFARLRLQSPAPRLAHRLAAGIRLARVAALVQKLGEVPGVLLSAAVVAELVPVAFL